MTDSQNPQPVSLAELRARTRHQCIAPGEDHADRYACMFVGVDRRDFDALLDIAEAAQAMFETAGNTHDADYWFEGDRIETLEAALAKVKP